MLTLNTLQQQKKQRWFYVSIGVVLLLFLGLIYAWSIFRIPLEQEFGWSKAQTSLTFSISMVMFCLGGLVSGIITERKGARWTLSFCALCLAAGFFGASRISTLTGIYLTYGVCCGFGVGLGYNASISTIVKWFPDKQGLISGIALMGFGLGGMILGTAGAGLIQQLGWRTTFIVFAAAFAGIILLGALLLRPAPFSFIQALTQEDNRHLKPYEDIDWRAMVRRKNFWLYFVYAFILTAGGLAVINISAVYAQDVLQSGLTQAAAAAGIISAANGLGRVLSGQIFDMKGYRITMITICLVFAAAAAALFLSEQRIHPVILFLAFGLIGLGYGGVPPINSAFTSQFFGSRHYPMNYSIMNLCILPASIVGPICTNSSYNQTFLIIFLFALLSLGIVLLIHRPKNS